MHPRSSIILHRVSLFDSENHGLKIRFRIVEIVLRRTSVRVLRRVSLCPTPLCGAHGKTFSLSRRTAASTRRSTVVRCNGLASHRGNAFHPQMPRHAMLCRFVTSRHQGMGSTRRDALRVFGGAGLLALGGGCAITSRAHATRRVVVVGAGYGGAPAARHAAMLGGE